jgi:hypothetical protein
MQLFKAMVAGVFSLIVIAIFLYVGAIKTCAPSSVTTKGYTYRNPMDVNASKALHHYKPYRQYHSISACRRDYREYAKAEHLPIMPEKLKQCKEWGTF